MSDGLLRETDFRYPFPPLFGGTRMRTHSERLKRVLNNIQHSPHVSVGKIRESNKAVFAWSRNRLDIANMQNMNAASCEGKKLKPSFSS